MADVICLSSEDEEELIFTEVDSGGDTDVKLEATHAVFLPETSLEELSPESCGAAEDIFAPEEPEESAKEAPVPEKEPVLSENEIKLKLLADRLAKALETPDVSKVCEGDEENGRDFEEKNAETRSPVDASEEYDRRKSNASDAEEVNIRRGPRKRRRGRPSKKVVNYDETGDDDTIDYFDHKLESERTQTHKNVQEKNKGKRKRRSTLELLMSTPPLTEQPIDNPAISVQAPDNLSSLQDTINSTGKEAIQSNSNLTPLSNIENIILQVSQGNFESALHASDSLAQQENKRSPHKRSKNFEDTNCSSKKLRGDDVLSETTSIESLDVNHPYAINPEHNHQEENTVQSIGNSYTETNFDDCPPHFSKKSIIMNKYNSSPSRRNRTSSESQSSTSRLPDETENNNSETSSLTRDQVNQSPTNEREKIEKLKIAISRGNGGEHSFSIVSPSQVSPECEMNNSSSVEEETTAENVVEHAAQLNSPSTNQNVPQNPDCLISNNAGSPNDTNKEDPGLKSKFTESYKIVFNKDGESWSITMARMILAIMKTQHKMVKTEVTHGISSQEYLDARQIYLQIFNELKPQFEDLFHKLCYRIQSTPHHDLFEWIFLAWFVKIVVFINNECKEYADKLHQVKVYVLNFIPKCYKTKPFNIEQFFTLEDDKFEKNMYTVVLFVKEIFQSEGEENSLTLDLPVVDANIVIKEENPEVSTQEVCTSNSFNDFPSNSNEISSKEPVLNKDVIEKDLNPAEELNPPTNSRHEPNSNNANLIACSPHMNSDMLPNTPMEEHQNVNVPCLEKDVATLIRKIFQDPSEHRLSVIKSTHSLSETPVNEVPVAYQQKVVQQQNVVGHTETNLKTITDNQTTNERNPKDKRLSIKVRSPLSLFKDPEQSNLSSSLPTFNDTFIHPGSYECDKMHTDDTNIPAHRQQVVAHNSIQKNTLHPSSLQTPLFKNKSASHHYPSYQPERYQSESSSLPIQKSDYYRQPDQHVENPSNYIQNYQPNVQLTRAQADRERWLNQPFIGGDIDYSRRNTTHQFNHPNVQQPHAAAYHNNPSARPATAYPQGNPHIQTSRHPPIHAEIQRRLPESNNNQAHYNVNQLLGPGSAYVKGNHPTQTGYSQISAEIDRYMSELEKPQNPVYHQARPSQSSFNRAYSNPNSNHQQSLTDVQLEQRIRLEQQYPILAAQMRTQQSSYHPATLSTTTSAQNNPLYQTKPPPPYGATHTKMYNPQTAPTNRHFQNYGSNPTQGWSTTPNQTVPVDTNVTIRPVDSNVTINNYNFTNYGTSPSAEQNYAPQDSNSFRLTNSLQPPMPTYRPS